MRDWRHNMDNEDLYWDFLINNRYFDKKSHLQDYFGVVLSNTKHDHMEQLSENDERLVSSF